MKLIVSLSMCLSLQLTAAQNEKCDSSKQDCDAAEIVVPVKKEAMTPAVVKPAFSWMLTTDDCDGFRKLNHFKELALAVSDETSFDPGADYKCPTGYQWASYEQIIPLLTVMKEPAVPYYSNLCGWEDNEWPESDGKERQFFLLKGSLDDDRGEYIDASDFEGTWRKKWGGGSDDGIGLDELRSTTEDELFAGIVCATDAYVDGLNVRIAEAKDYPDWMETSDGFQGFKVMTHFPHIALAVAKATTLTDEETGQKSEACQLNGDMYDKIGREGGYSCPTGWVIAKKGDVKNDLTGSRQEDCFNYQKQGGWGGNYGVVWQGVTRFGFLFSDSFTDLENGLPDAAYIDAYDSEGTPIHDLYQKSGAEAKLPAGQVLRQRMSARDFGGFVCVTEEAAEKGDDRRALAASYPEWMGTNDGSMGFRQLLHWPSVYLAVSKNGKFERGKNYDCPEGYGWANRNQIEALMLTPAPQGYEQQQGVAGWMRSPGRSYYAYSSGWNGGVFEGVARVAFLFKDTMIKGGYLLSAGSEGEIRTLWNVQELRTKMVTSSFAGIVCICSPTRNDCPPSREEALANDNSVSVDGKDEL